MPATLLAVDDSVTMRKVLEMTFAGEDFRVVTAESADAALAKLKSENPSLVLTDVTLPGKDGYDLCTAIKRDNPGIPVLLLSSKLAPYDKTKGQAAKADDYIDKPFDTQKLIDKINGLLSGDKKVVQGAPKAAPAPYRAPASLGATLVGQGAPPRPQAPKSPPMASPPGRAQPGNLRSTADF
ncbi:MAG: response regulator transcription factor, partial [Myxococcota bacterium]